MKSRAWRQLLYALIGLVLVSLVGPLARADISDAIDRVRPSVVMVGVFRKLGAPQFLLRGTGFAVGDGRTVATAAHVVSNLDLPAGESGSLVIRLAAGDEGSLLRPARLIAMDEGRDLALLRVDGPALPALVVGDSATVKEGRLVAFTGFPIGGALGFVPVTHRGMVSAVTPVAIPSATAASLKANALRRLRQGAFPIFQLDATAYPGNSGGPLFDTGTGEVLGVISMVIIKGTKEAALTHPSGISYAVPATFLSALMEAGS